MFKISAEEKRLYLEFRDKILDLECLLAISIIPYISDLDILYDLDVYFNKYLIYCDYKQMQLNPRIVDEVGRRVEELTILYKKLEKTPTFGPIIHKDYSGEYYKYYFNELKTLLSQLCIYTGLTENKYFKNLSDASIEDVNILFSWYKNNLLPKIDDRNYLRSMDKKYVECLVKMITLDFDIFMNHEVSNAPISGNLID